MHWWRDSSLWQQRVSGMPVAGVHSRGRKDAQMWCTTVRSRREVHGQEAVDCPQVLSLRR